MARLLELQEGMAKVLGEFDDTPDIAMLAGRVR
jgi:hypothetical protein